MNLDFKRFLGADFVNKAHSISTEVDKDRCCANASVTTAVHNSPLGSIRLHSIGAASMFPIHRLRGETRFSGLFQSPFPLPKLSRLLVQGYEIFLAVIIEDGACAVTGAHPGPDLVSFVNCRRPLVKK
jgi:hypothetical protein